MRISTFLVSAALLGAPVAITAQSQPFIVHDTKPVITRGPILIDPSETGVTVVWTTDTPTHAMVRYGTGATLDGRAESAHDGLLDVGTVHAVRVTGLAPGRTYNYQISATRVVKIKAYWPEKGLETVSAVQKFTTLDRAKNEVRFASISDTHESLPRIDSLMRAIDWANTDFLVHTGDAFDWIDSEEQLFAKFLDPIGKGLAQTRGMMFARGNHEWRGAFARELGRYLSGDDNRFYFARDHGPVHFVVLDSGEDKPDSTNVYSRLNRSEPYLASELAWLSVHAKSDRRAIEAPFRVAMLHQPNWGSMPGGREAWYRTANEAGVDLVIAGHTHRFSRTDPGADGRQFTTVVVGQGQYADVKATSAAMTVIVRSSAGAVIDSVTIVRRRK